MKPSTLIEYFRRCYRADSYDLSISNIEKIRSDRRLFIAGEDALASGSLPRIPLVDAPAAELLEQADSYRREKRLVYGCFIVTGRVAGSGFGGQRKLCAPLIYAPATLYRDDDIFLEVDASDVRANLPLLRLLLKPDMDSSVVDSFPTPQWPLGSSQITAMGQWLQQYTQLQEIEELGRWPRLQGAEAVAGRARAQGLRLTSACSLVLADRSKSVRGVLHELSRLAEDENYSAPLGLLLGRASGGPGAGASAPEMLPESLSEAQVRALHNAARQPLSLVSGPPGTGKSFTIAAMAIDRMLHGESVLVVSRTPQAIDVVSGKLKTDYGLDAGYVHAGERGFLHSLKAHLDSLLKEGVPRPREPAAELRAELKQIRRQLGRAERRFTRALRAARRLGSDRLPAWLAGILGALYRPLLETDSLWGFQDSIGTLRQRFEQRAASYLNAYRLERLAALLERERGNLSLFNQALRARTSRRQAERFGQTDFDAILQAYPIWLVGLDEVSQVFPFGRQMFDLVIFDESTQCDIASALPALQRARRAVVVGDGKQLRHVSFLSAKRQQALWRNCDLDGEVPSRYSYRDQSLLDLVSDAIGSQRAVTLLDEHYRSRPELIAFSNRHFYDGRLKVMQARPGASDSAALEFRRVDGRRSASGRNAVERDAVLEALRRHIDRYCRSPVKPSVGVLSPYRDQAEYLEGAIRKAFSSQELADFCVRVATPYGFQGEERDLMLLSLSIDRDSIRAAGYLNRPDMFNVAVTRARERQVVIHSIDGGDLPPGNLLERYLSFGHGAGGADGQRDFVCRFATEVSEALAADRVDSWIGFTVAGQEIDVVCERHGSLVGVDLIGYPGEFVEHFSVQTYHALYRAGIHVVPLPYRNWQRDRDGCRERLLRLLPGRAAEDEEEGGAKAAMLE
ncbi:DEAD/DEAH box helicase [Microbulbifer litoralis]|uniref:DEAD/DEAH box helicase n=1 Tax=Microbulbifer litoralis TaxID=2933965 RepID=UPI0020298A6A|nr:AAA domain-containing protein [Microbulbifer sp. GX H0434]